MSALRFVSSAARRAPTALSAARGRRGYAEASDKIKLSLVLPHQSLDSSEVTQVNLSAASGDMGILANHIPTVEALRPGLIEIIEATGGAPKKFFASGGFLTVHPNNQLTINVVEAAPLEDFSLEAVRANLAEAQKTIAGNGSDADKAEAQVEVDVYEALQSALA